MKSKEILNLAVRLLGLVFLYHGLQTLPVAIGQVIGLFGIRMDMSLGALLSLIFMTAWPFVVSFWLLRGAPLVMRTAYPDGVDAPLG